TALAAYARATLRAPQACGLGWTTLAALRWVESQHGTLGGRILGLDGVSSQPVLGPALDGAAGFRAIPASRRGTALHGDARWDHALGPMQFITSTWQQWGADGDGDGSRDPQDVDDAAWAAARYLCADGHDLGGGAGWSAAIYSYNRSQAYLDSIYATASEYAARVGGRSAG
ncbi:MAG: lytic murein transglycosylase, partial [Nocardioides sp.]|nr:lytic murein transglycosylase [Nocardioides sp.]